MNKECIIEKMSNDPFILSFKLSKADLKEIIDHQLHSINVAFTNTSYNNIRMGNFGNFNILPVKTQRNLIKIENAKAKYLKDLEIEENPKKITTLKLKLLSAEKEIKTLTNRLKNYNEKLKNKPNSRGDN